MVLFVIAAVIGLYLISFVLKDQLPSKGLAMTHGALAATGLILLIVHMYNTGADMVQIIALFVITALGGIIMFIRHLTGKTIPKALAVIHGLLAIISFGFLVFYTYNK
jgi:hypothetical protein